MDFSLSEEQTMLSDSIARFIDSDYDFEKRQAIAASNAGFSSEMWRTFAELGWTAVPFSEADGGLEGGPVELMLMMEQFGRGLVVEPYLANVVLAGGILKRVANATQKSQWLSPLIEGELHTALAFAEPQSRFDLADIATTASKDSDSYVLNGRKTFVLNGNSADMLIIPARTSGDRTDESGITMFAVPADAPGLRRQAYATIDGLQAAEVILEDVRVDAENILGEAERGYATLASVIDEATLAICAEALGIAQTMQNKTVEYAKMRMQFGVPISSFQALQHRMVDTAMLCEQSRSLLYWCVMLNVADDAQASRSISALKYQIGTAGIKVGREAVQIHGGMGVTWELDVAHYFKRLSAIDVMFGNADFHLDRFIALE